MHSLLTKSNTNLLVTVAAKLHEVEYYFPRSRLYFRESIEVFRQPRSQALALWDGKKRDPGNEVGVPAPGWRGGTLGISRWGCAARTLEPLAYTRANFSWILLPYTRVNSLNHS